ncbi:MAG: 3-keto-5-aminohexanoate cleavage protein [Thermoleophilia bacterium]|nr:3-keto-5-aminohexanoate cleavage protein [Thermoleophilia bacterium]
MDKLVITVGITGGGQQKATNPYLPVTPREIIESAYGAWKAGASVVHLHVRDAAGKSCIDLDLYRQVMDGVRERCDVIVNLSTDPGGDIRQEDRITVLDLAPEMAGFDAGTIHLGNYDDLVWGPMPYLREMAARMREVGTVPQCEVFHEGMIGTCEQLADEGLIPRPVNYIFGLGVPGCAPATPETLMHMIRQVPPGSVWSTAGVDLTGPPLAAVAIAMGGHVRTGIEDEPWYRAGQRATTNAELVERVVRIATELERPVATPAEARRIVGLTR